MQVGIIADDLTGAMDSGAQLARAGYRVAVMFHDAPFPPSGDLDVVVVDTDSRQRDTGAAGARVSEAARRLKDARVLYKKIDSTLRGPVAEEVEAAFREGGRSGAIIAPAFPGNGRTTHKGFLMVHGEPVQETGFSEDPGTPVKEGHIPTLLAGTGAIEIGTLETGVLSEAASVRRALEEYRWVVADAAHDTHLKALVEAVPDPSEVLWVGSAGLVKAYGDVYPGPRAGENPSPDVATGRNVSGLVAPSGRVLAVVGSTNETSRGQLRRLEEEPGVEAVTLSAADLAAGKDGPVEEASRTAGSLLTDGKSVALRSSEEELPEGAAGRVVRGLAEVVSKLSEGGLFDALVLTGGDTAIHVSRRLGARGIMLEGEIEPGVARGTLICPSPYPTITKAGGFGTPETLLHALHALGRGPEGKGKQL
ncbi:MAG: four-carbon acid sugar kinase family protein [Rubrobacteraceae bacterium]